METTENSPGFKRPRRAVRFLKTSYCACSSDSSCGHSRAQSDELATSSRFEQFHNSVGTHFLGKDGRLGPFPAPPKSVEQNNSSFDAHFLGKDGRLGASPFQQSSFFDAHFLGKDGRLGAFPLQFKSGEQNKFNRSSCNVSPYDHNFPKLIACSKSETTKNSKVESSESHCGTMDTPPTFDSEASRGLSLDASRSERKGLLYGGFLCPVMTTNQSFQTEAERIRAMCMAERLELESRPSGRLAPLLVTDKPMPDTGALGQVFDGCEINEIGMSHDGWQVLSVAIDSGAAETVIPHRLVAQHPVRATQSSKNGMCYASATGQPIPNLGEQCLPLITQEGTLRGMTFQAAPVSKALGSVKRMCSSGHRVVFDEDGSYVENKTTGEINWLREEAGNYMLDLWVIPPEEMPANAGFGRQS